MDDNGDNVTNYHTNIKQEAFLTLPLLGAPPAAEREVAPAPASTAPGAIHQVKMGNGATVGLPWPIAAFHILVVSG